MKQAGHDGLAGARVVGQAGTAAAAGQHLAVDGGDLVRQRVDERGVDGQQRVEQVGEPDALGLGDQAEQRAVAIETPRPACRCDLQGRFAVAVEQLAAKFPAASL